MWPDDSAAVSRLSITSASLFPASLSDSFLSPDSFFIIYCWVSFILIHYPQPSQIQFPLKRSPLTRWSSFNSGSLHESTSGDPPDCYSCRLSPVTRILDVSQLCRSPGCETCLKDKASCKVTVLQTKHPHAVSMGIN